MLPGDLLQSLQCVDGFDEKAFVDVHQQGGQIVSVRYNPDKEPFGQENIFPGSEQIPWSSFGYYLPSRPSFTLDPLLHAGVYYVQEASSMFLEQCLSQSADLSSPLKVLDLCAAPGGKSTLIQSLISPESLLVSNEVIKTRVNILTENLSKWGGVNTIVTNNDPRDFNRLENYFDIMVVDAPCSGSGLFRRDPDAAYEWSLEAVKMCSLRQQRILADAYSSLKQDGVLIYSTCSYSLSENEEVCDWLSENYNVTTIKLDILPAWKINETVSNKSSSYGYRFFPDKLKGEGFFIACFRKNDGEPECAGINKKKRLVPVSAAERAFIDPWLNDPSSVDLYHLEKEIFAFPKTLQEDLININSNLYTKKAGVPVGRLMKNELVPAHELALSGIVNENLFSISLKKDTALQYLRKEEITLQTDKKGWALVRYEGQNLGWVKILQNRANNYYPKEWRILKSGTN
jgi:NOL1/NOP2/sun family putative RNA methylase